MSKDAEKIVQQRVDEACEVWTWAAPANSYADGYGLDAVARRGFALGLQHAVEMVALGMTPDQLAEFAAEVRKPRGHPYETR